MNLPSSLRSPPMRLPRLLVEIGVEPGQHHRAMRQLRHRMQEFRGRRHRTGRARRDHRALVMLGQPLGFGGDQQIAPRRRLDLADLLQMIRPQLSRDAQEVERQLPVFVEIVGHEAVEPVPDDIARHHVVDQPREIGGQRQRRGRAADHQRRETGCLWPRPRRDGRASGGDRARRASAECRAAAAPSSCSASPAKASSSSSMSPSGDDARQHRGVRLQFVEEDFARDPHRAPRRQVQRRVGKRGRIAARLESVDQPAVDQRGDHGAQERHGKGNAANAHGRPDSRNRQAI